MGRKIVTAVSQLCRKNLTRSFAWSHEFILSPSLENKRNHTSSYAQLGSARLCRSVCSDWQNVLIRFRDFSVSRHWLKARCE
jgi:hypothetical protein